LRDNERQELRPAETQLAQVRRVRQEIGSGWILQAAKFRHAKAGHFFAIEIAHTQGAELVWDEYFDVFPDG
jgi:hypothetical protein